MNRRANALSVTAAVAVALTLAPTSVMADMTKGQCIAANTKAQDLRRDGKLSEARAQLQTCGDPSCPALVRDDCTRRLNELEGAQPTIIFDAKDGSGHDLSAVSVTMDGHPFADKLDGKALPVDPGEHEFTFTVAEQPPVTEKIVIKESAKERHESLVIGTPPPPPAVAVDMAPAPAAAAEGMGTQKKVGIVLGAVGIAGVAVGGVFGLLTASAISKQKTDCASSANCANHAQAASDHSTWTTDGTVSTVAFIAGGALIASGAVLFFTARHATEEPTAAGLVVMPSLGPSGGGMLLRGEF
jgi:hypothetical protein